MRNKKIHFMGAGGIGISALMYLSKNQGAIVSGCDLKKNSTTMELEKSGMQIYYGHSPAHLEGVDLVVYSSAITEQNLELKYAKEIGLEYIKRSVMLDRLMAKNKVIGVTGSHGKTTTTALISKTLLDNDYEPSVAVGGICPFLCNSNFRIGKGEWYVTEMDESDASLLDTLPLIGVLTNVDREHIEFYGSYENLLEAIETFFRNVSSKGTLVYCRDDDILFNFASKISSSNAISYGFHNDADAVISEVKISDIGMTFRMVYKNQSFIIQSEIVGNYNALNITAALLSAHKSGIEFDAAIKSVSTFKNVKRRFDIVYSSSVVLIDDYAHHPTEIKACLKTCVERFKDKTIVAIFQAHRFTRLKNLWEEFKEALTLADEIIVCEVYSASEDAIDGITGDKLAFELYEGGFKKVQYIPHFESIIDYLYSSVDDSKVVVSLGAGDVNKVVYELKEKLNALNCFNE